MKRHLGVFAITAAALLVSSAPSQAQNPAPASEPAAVQAIPLRVQLVISRSQGDKVTSRVPFTFIVNAAAVGPSLEPSRLRLGVEIPVVSTPVTADAKAEAGRGQTPSIQYKPIGTNIDCTATQLPKGRFKVSLTVEESSPYGEQDRPTIGSIGGDGRPASSMPVFRTYRASNVVVLQDGQSEQFWTAMDRFTGEVLKMDVTVSVIK